MKEKQDRWQTKPALWEELKKLADENRRHPTEAEKALWQHLLTFIPIASPSGEGLGNLNHCKREIPGTIVRRLIGVSPSITGAKVV